MIKYIHVLASSGQELENVRHKLRGLFHPDIKFILVNKLSVLKGFQDIIVIELDGWTNDRYIEKDIIIQTLLERRISLWLKEQDINKR